MLRDHWYPLVRTRDLPGDKPLAAQLLGEPLVLFRDSSGAPRALADRCGHRSVPLSLGRVCDGMIECAYHGWQFGGSGECQRIPTRTNEERMPKASSVPARATQERAGIVWVYAGALDDADPAAIPDYPQLTSPDWWIPAQGVMTLDIDYSLLIENLVDPSHVPFTHRGTLATPDLAQPLTVDVRSTREGGLHGVLKATRKPPLPIPDYYAFDPPCHVRIGRNDGSLTRLFHCVPVAPGRMLLIWWLALERSRLDLRTRLQLRVPYLARREEEAWTASQNAIFAEDIMMLVAQTTRLSQGAKAFACPVKADLMALRCREWREENDGPGTWFETYAAPAPTADGPRRLQMLLKDGTTG